MKIIRAVFLSMVVCGLAGADGVTLEDSSSRVILRDSRIVSLLDKQRSLEHVSADLKELPGLFHIQFVKGVELAGEIDAAQMTVQVLNHTAGSAEIRFEHAKATAFVRINLGRSVGETHWSINVQPRDEALAVSRVAFPVFATPRSAGGKEKSCLLPLAEGRYAPLANRPLWRAHPARLFAQMIACIGTDGGFVLWTDDGAGHVKEFGYDNRQKYSIFAVRHLMPYQPGRAWEPSYQTRLTFCGGQWQDAADIYRAWATRQPWSGTPFRDRRDMPELLRSPPLCISTQLNKEERGSLPDRLAAWGARFGVPVVYRPLGWEKHGNWVGIDYFPPAMGGDRFVDLMARLEERNVVTAGFISGYRWTTQLGHGSPQENQALAEHFEQHHGASCCEQSREGGLLTFKAEGRDSNRICRGTPMGRRFLPDTARQLFDLGVTVIHDDQDHGPSPDGEESCFNFDHGHPVPCGPWSTAATSDSFKAIRSEAARRGLKDFFLTKESCSELLNMDLHAYQARFFHESTRPGLVPLAQYLYHEHIPSVFGWVTASSGSQWELAAMMVYGQIPSISFWNAPAERPDAIPAASLTLLDDYYAAMKAHARPFLLYGRMQRPLIADVPAVTKKITEIKGNKRPPRTIIVPQVIQSAWSDKHGDVGVFAVNTQRKEMTLQVAVPKEGRWHAVFYTGATKGRELDAAAGEELPWRMSPNRLEAIVFKRRN